MAQETTPDSKQEQPQGTTVFQPKNLGNSTVYQDLEKLEQAITLEHADLKLQHEQLQEQMAFLEHSKRLVVPDVLRFIVVPLFYAYGLSKVTTGTQGMVLQRVGKALTQAMDYHFWIAVVALPQTLNLVQWGQKAWRRISGDAARRTQLVDMEDPFHAQYQNLDPNHAKVWLTKEEYYELVPDESTDDTVSFLIEYWTSAVNGLTFLYLGKAIANRLWGLQPFQSRAAVLWLACAQFVTRLAAAVSLYQYPEKMYDLERSEVTRPVGFFPTVMLKLVRGMMAFCPLGLISDFARVLSNLPKGSIYPLYASIAVYLYGTWTRMRESVASKNDDPLAVTVLKPPKLLPKLCYGLGFLALWRNQLRTQLRPLYALMNTTLTYAQLCKVYNFLFWRTLGFGFLVSLSMLGPLIHLKAFSKLFVVEYKNDLPTLSSKESYEKAIAERPERAYDMAWRYNLLWREPERLVVSKGWIFHDILYLLFFRDMALEQYRKNRDAEIEERACRGKLLTDRIPLDVAASPDKSLLFGDRDNWKQKAMNLMMNEHKSSYEKKTFRDPLGIAIYKAFGIGLGFNFDHTSALKEGEEPSNRRLQARAAKSAMKRYNELNKAEQALISKIEQAKDPEQKELYQELLDVSKKEFDEEIKYLASRLQELIPTVNRDDEFPQLDVSKFKMKQQPDAKYVRISSHEYRQLAEDPLGLDKPSLEKELV